LDAYIHRRIIDLDSWFIAVINSHRLFTDNSSDPLIL
jgi:hypothetical protein